MAVRLIALYATPEDPAAFDAHYHEVHAPIVRRYPGLIDLRLTRADGVADSPPPFYLVAEMTFDSRTALDAALASEAGVESGFERTVAESPFRFAAFEARPIRGVRVFTLPVLREFGTSVVRCTLVRKTDPAQERGHDGRSDRLRAHA